MSARNVNGDACDRCRGDAPYTDQTGLIYVCGCGQGFTIICRACRRVLTSSPPCGHYEAPAAGTRVWPGR